VQHVVGDDGGPAAVLALAGGGVEPFEGGFADELRSERHHGLFDYPGGDDEYSEALELLVTERRRLAALSQRPSGWVEVETGETFADAWNSADQEHRRLMRINMEARLYISPNVTGWHLPKELHVRLGEHQHGGS
jgi:hypothetical protein